MNAIKSRFLIDIGSSTVKVYQYNGNHVELIQKKTFRFKKEFSKEIGLSEENRKALIEYFQQLDQKYRFNNRNVKIYATGLFRDMIDYPSFVQWFFEKTGLYFNIITHDLEAFYLKKAWLGSNSNSVGKMLVINIGGRTTEVLLCENGEIIGEPQKFLIGVGTVNECFEQLNSQISPYDYHDIEQSLLKEIEKQADKQTHKYLVAIYTGGELDYMKRAGYPLVPNSIFQEIAHPFMISEAQYRKRNTEIFSKVSLDELKIMMPENPGWMEGARACSVLANAICKYYGVEYIVPSDSNLIDGVVVQEAEKVVICGSFNKYLPQIAELMTLLKKKGIKVLSPSSTEVTSIEGDFVVFKDDVIKNHNTWAVEELHLKAIDHSDFVIACNFDNYIGVSTTFELEHAYRNGKKIVFIEDNEIADKFGCRIGISKMPCEIGIL